MNLRVVVVITICFAIGITSLYFVNEWYFTTTDLQKWFYSKQTDNPKMQIFIIGNSHVVRVDPNLIQEVLQKNEFEYDVYNISIDANGPHDRIHYLQEIIEARPELIVYGIDFHNFMSQINGVIISPQQEIAKKMDIQSYAKLLFSEIMIDSQMINFKNFKNPKLTSLKIISGDIKFNNGSYINSPKTPFGWTGFPPTTMNTTQLEEKVMKDPWTKYGRFIDYNSAGFIALKKILKSLDEENIPIILFLTPYHELYRNEMPDDDKKLFFSMIEELKNEFNVEVYDFHDKYSDKDIWADAHHISPHAPGGEIYSEDVAKIILEAVKNNVI